MNTQGYLIHVHSEKDVSELKCVDAKSAILEIKTHKDSMVEGDPFKYFTDCYDLDDYNKPTKLIINLNKAKKVWLDVIRAVRDRRLEELDKLTIRALGRGNQQEVTRIEGIKQLLRDLPKQTIQQLEQAQSIDDIMRIRPPELLFE